MAWTIIYLCMILLGVISLIMLLNNKFIPKETRKKLSKKDLKVYKNNLIKVSISFILASILFLIQHYFDIKNLLIYVPITLLGWYGVKNLVNNLNMINR